MTYFNLILYKHDNFIGNCSVTSHLNTWWLTIIYKSTAEVGGSPLSSLMQILSAAEEAGSSAQRGWAVKSLGFSWLLIRVPQLFCGRSFSSRLSGAEQAGCRRGSEEGPSMEPAHCHFYHVLLVKPSHKAKLD